MTFSMKNNFDGADRQSIVGTLYYADSKINPYEVNSELLFSQMNQINTLSLWQGLKLDMQ